MPEARRVEMMAVDGLKSADRNPKQHDARAIDESMGRFGYVEPVVLDERTKKLVAGHGRIAALTAMKKAGKAPPAGVTVQGGKWLVPVLRGWKSRNEREAEAYLVASNRITEAGGWDEKMLADLLGGLRGDGGLAGTGYGDGYVDALIRELERGEGPAVGRTPDELLAGFMAATIKQIVLYFEGAEYDSVAARLEAVRTKLALESNTQVVVKLLEAWEAQHAGG